jgi:hypothetical protein
MGGSASLCSLVSSLSRDSAGEVLGLAVLACAGPTPVAPSALSQLPDLAHEPVALAGFSRSRAGFSAAEQGASTRHVRMTRLSSSLQLSEAPPDGRPRSTTVALAAGSPSSASDFGVPLGYLEHRPEQGMGGGPVLDVHCRLVGIIKEQSVHGQGGAYVRLGEPLVQHWVVEALSKASNTLGRPTALSLKL